MNPSFPRFPVTMSAARASTSHRTITPNSDGASGMRIANVSDELLARVEGPSTGKSKAEAPDVMSVQLLASLLSEMSDSPPFPSSPLPSPRSPSAAALHSLHPVASPRRAVLPPERAQHAKCAARCEDGNIAPDAAVASSEVPAAMRMGESRIEVAPVGARLRGADARDYPLARALAELEAQDRAREMATRGTRRAERAERARTDDLEAREVRTTGSDSSAQNMSVTSAEARHRAEARGGGGIEDIIAHLPRSSSASLAHETQEIARVIESRRGESDGCAFPRRSGSLVGRGAHARQQADGGSGSSSSVDCSASRFSAFVASREDMVRALTAHLRRPSAEPASPRKASTHGAFTEPGPSEPGPSESAISEPVVHARSMTASGGRSAIRPRTSGGERSERAIASGEGWDGGVQGRSRAEHVRRRLMGSSGEQGGAVGRRETAGGVGMVMQAGGSMGQWSDFGVGNSGAVVGAVGGGAGGAEAGGVVRGDGSSGMAERWQAGRVGSAQQSMGPPAPRVAGGWRGAAVLRAPPTAVAAAAAAGLAGSASSLSGSAAAVAAGSGVAGATATAGGLSPTGWPTHAALPPPMPRLPHMPLFPHSASMPLPLPPHSSPSPLLPHSAPIPLTPHSPPRFNPHSQPIPLRPHTAPATAFPHSPSAPRLPHAPGTPNTPSTTTLPGQPPAPTTPLASTVNTLVPHMNPFLPPHQGAWHVGAAAAEGTAGGASAGAAAAASVAGSMGLEEELLWCEFDAMLMGAPTPMHTHGTAVNPMGAHSTEPHPMGVSRSSDIMHVGAMPPVQAHLPLAAHGTGGRPLAELHTAPVPSGSGGSVEGEAGTGAEVGAEAEGGIERGDMSGMEVLGEGGGGAGGSGSSGGRGKNKSVVEKERRERISQELQRLRQTVRGRGDMAAMLDGAVAYVEQLKAQHRELEATLLQHQLTCTCPQCHQLGQP
ncbi:unnamed protein product [Closterium sp. NIES-54]